MGFYGRIFAVEIVLFAEVMNYYVFSHFFVFLNANLAELFVFCTQSVILVCN